MNVNKLLRAVALALAASISAACAGLQQTPVAPQPAAGVSMLQLHGNDATWMTNGLKKGDLLYVSNSNGTVSVYSYQQGTLVGVLTKFKEPTGECTDMAGNVYVPDYLAKKIYEYAHGAKKALRVVDDAPYRPYDCAVSPKNGDLAVANYGTGIYTYSGYGNGNIAIYPHGHGTPVYYGASNYNHFSACAYDRHGDLLASTRWGYSGIVYYETGFVYLPHGSKTLLPMNLPTGTSSGWDWIQGLAWDGKYWVVVYYNHLYQYSINIQAKMVGDVKLSDGYGAVGQVAFYNGGRKAQATQVVGASSKNSGKSVVDYWSYPAGGNPVNDITKGLETPFGVAISLGSGS